MHLSISCFTGDAGGRDAGDSISAYEAAFEQFNYWLGSAIAILIGFAQLVIVGAVLAARRLAYMVHRPLVRGDAHARCGHCWQGMTTAVWLFLCFMVLNILGLIGTGVVNWFATN